MKGSHNMPARMRWLKTGTFGLVIILALSLLVACSGADDGDGDDSAETPFPTATAGGSGSAVTPTAAGTDGTATAPTEATTPADDEPTATAAAPDTTPTAAVPAATPTTAAPAPTATQQPGPEDLLTLRVYFVRDEKIASVERQVVRTQQVAAAAMEQLLIGPSDAEEGIGFGTALPDGVEYLGTAIEEGVATVNLSGEFEHGGGSQSMLLRLAQVVYTLTQYPTITSVIFALDGTPVDVFGGEGVILEEPQTRAMYEDLTPLILVETPGPFTNVPTEFTVAGTSNTFEAAMQIQVVTDDGTLLYDQPAFATSGTGTRGTFEETITIDAAEGDEVTLRVFEYSAKDGSEINIVELPLTIAT